MFYAGGILGSEMPGQYRYGSTWTKDDDNALRALARDGETRLNAAERLGRTKYAIKARAFLLSISFGGAQTKGGYPLWTPAEDELMRAAAKAGETVEAASRFIGRTAGAIVHRSMRLGVHFKGKDPRGAVWTRQRLSDAATWWKAGRSGGVIAKQLDCGVTRSAVIAKMNRLGLGNIPGRYQRPPAKTKPEKRPRVAATPKRPKKSVHYALGPLLRRRPTPSKAPSLPADVATDVARVTHEQLNSRHCRWPVGDPDPTIVQRKPFYCGKRRMPGLPYCGEHCARAFREISAFPRQSYPTPGIV